MRSLASFSVVALLAAALGTAQRAGACGPGLPSLYAVAGQWPEGDGAPLNTPLLVKLDATGASSQASPTPQLILTDPSGAVVPIRLGNTTADWSVSFVPTSSLAPVTTYGVAFASGQLDEAGSAEAGKVSWSFTTGTEVRAPLELEGGLSAVLEPGTQDVVTCPGDCTCTTTGTLAVTKARVRLPSARHGFAPRTGELWLTNDRPYAFTTEMKDPSGTPYEELVQLSTVVSLESDEPAEALLTVPSEGRPYRPCFAFRATDARGDVVYADPVCLEIVDVPTEQPVEAGPTDSPSGGKSTGSRSTSACSVNAAKGGASTKGVLLLGLLMAPFWARRRGRQRSALA